MSNRITKWMSDLTQRMQSVSDDGLSKAENMTEPVKEEPANFITVRLSRNLFAEMQRWAFTSAMFHASRKHALSREGAFSLAERQGDMAEDMEAIEAQAKKAGWLK